jgi:sterol desaturase/sphingolipid hydroxylase (fatty acid hydroxylase superfamily)
MLVVILAFVVSIVGGTLVEYAGHRVLHAGLILGRRHADHHGHGLGQGVLGEFVDYALPFAAVSWVGFLHSLAVGVGFALGGLTYAGLAAYAHQLQHERPELVFWLPRPVHYLHHRHQMWHHNFGILVDVWDRVFGTYKAVDWNPKWPSLAQPWHAFFRIRWY